MTKTSWPFENQPTTELQYSRLFRELQDSGICATYGASDLTVSASGSSTISLAAGNALVRGFMFQSTATESLTVPAVLSGGHRMDLVVLRLDTNANKVSIEIAQGNATAAPNPTQTWPTDPAGIWELPLAAIDTTTAGVVTVSADMRAFVGDRWGTWTTLTRPTSPRIGKAGFNTTTGLIEWWNGTQWISLPSKGDTGWINIPLASGYTFSASSFFKLRKIDTAVHCDIYLTGATAGSSPGYTPGNAITATIANGITGWLPAGDLQPGISATANQPLISAAIGNLLETNTGLQLVFQRTSASSPVSLTDCVAVLRRTTSATGTLNTPYRARGLLWVLD